MRIGLRENKRAISSGTVGVDFYFYSTVREGLGTPLAQYSGSGVEEEGYKIFRNKKTTKPQIETWRF